MKPVKVKRDYCGVWIHPDLPKFDESTELTDIQAWLSQYGLTCDTVLMEGEMGELWANSEIKSCIDWEPEIPEGAFLLGIWDTEDGVVAMYAMNDIERLHELLDDKTKDTEWLHQVIDSKDEQIRRLTFKFELLKLAISLFLVGTGATLGFIFGG